MLTLQLYLSHVKAESTTVTGSNFQLYFPATTKLAFQHCSSLYSVNPFTVTLTVNSGTLNGTSTTLTMGESSGTLTFQNEENTIISFPLTDEVTITVNGQRYSTPVSLLPNQGVTISWNYFKPEFLLPIMFILGMFGLGSMFGGPIYGIYKVKHGEYFDGFKTGLVITVLGIALTIAWLWA
jgi:hypothetical protein